MAGMEITMICYYCKRAAERGWRIETLLSGAGYRLFEVMICDSCAKEAILLKGYIGAPVPSPEQFMVNMGERQQLDLTQRITPYESSSAYLARKSLDK